MTIDQKTQNRVEKILSNKKGVYSGVFKVESGDGTLKWSTPVNDMDVNRQYFIASVTKLYITTLILTLEKQGKLDLSSPIHRYLEKDMVSKLHIHKGVDYSNKITVRHLITNSSGLPDYFFHKLPDGKTFASNILNDIDVAFTLEETIDYVKGLKPKFYPGEKRKAAYSDTNYQLLGKIIENITNMSIHEAFEEIIFKALGLVNTYTYQDPKDNAPIPFYYHDKKLWVPTYMASITSEGGIVSTADEVMIYLKSFFQGFFFDSNKIDQLKDWRLILPPPSMFYFGVGLEKLFIPRFVSPLKPITEILGFWGQTGSFAWYSPQTDLYFTGTTNQIDGSGHAAAMKAILTIIKAAL